MPHTCNLFIQRHPDLCLLRCLNVVDEFKSAKSGPAKSVSAYVTAGNVRMLLVHEHKSGMKAFFEEVHRLYVKVRS